MSQAIDKKLLRTLEPLSSLTPDKLDELASVLGIHPITLLAITYTYAKKGETIENLIKKVSKESKHLTNSL